jgi:hypothetical protein
MPSRRVLPPSNVVTVRVRPNVGRDCRSFCSFCLAGRLRSTEPSASRSRAMGPSADAVAANIAAQQRRNGESATGWPRGPTAPGSYVGSVRHGGGSGTAQTSQSGAGAEALPTGSSDERATRALAPRTSSSLIGLLRAHFPRLASKHPRSLTRPGCSANLRVTFRELRLALSRQQH